MKLVIRPAAREDILRQYRYYLIEKDAEAAAERFLAAVRTAMEQLFQHPFAGSPKHLRSAELEGLRTWTVKGFPAIRVYYLVYDERILVVRVLHGRRDLGRLLERDVEPK